MDSPDRPRSFTRTRLGSPSPDPPDWVNGSPTSAIGQSCAFCGTDDVAWVHPLARDLLSYREFGKEHTLPTFWSLCERCEEIYASGDDDAAVEVMRSSSWAWVEADAVAESIRQPLAVFRGRIWEAGASRTGAAALGSHRIRALTIWTRGQDSMPATKSAMASASRSGASSAT